MLKSSMRRISSCFVLLALLCVVSATAAPEAVLLQKVDEINDKAVIMRRNGEQYEIQYGVGVISISSFLGKAVVINSPGIFLGVGSSIVLPGRDQSARIWDSTPMGGGLSSSPALPSSSESGVIEREISLFDAKGEAVAYIDTEDSNEMVIYLWTGEPVAYVRKASYTREAASIYGFNGRHLGWFESGVVRTHKGKAVGFVRDAIRNIAVKAERTKQMKRMCPMKDMASMAPMQPMAVAKFSLVPLRVFLGLGSKEEIDFDED
jgi:hypothetical protein